MGADQRLWEQVSNNIYAHRSSSWFANPLGPGLYASASQEGWKVGQKDDMLEYSWNNRLKIRMSLIMFFLHGHRISCAVLQVLMASHHGYAMWVVIVYQFINNAQSRTGNTKKASKKAPTDLCSCWWWLWSCPFFIVKFQHPTHWWEALAGSQFTIEHLDGRRLLYAAISVHDTRWCEWPFSREFHPGRNCTFHLLPINSFK